MGVDHNYLDDLTNHAILQKVARQCYLPMNALLLNLIKEQKGQIPLLVLDHGVGRPNSSEPMRPKCSTRSANWLPRDAWSSWPRPTPTRWHRSARRRISRSR